LAAIYPNSELQQLYYNVRNLGPKPLQVDGFRVARYEVRSSKLNGVAEQKTGPVAWRPEFNSRNGPIIGEELNPDYSIFVCRNATLQACAANNVNVWIPFDVWVTLPDDEDIGYRLKRRPDAFTTLEQFLYELNSPHSSLGFLGVNTHN
jgi:hypothetical protein